MALGSRRLQDWKQPSHIILICYSSLILFFFPTKCTFEDSEDHDQEEEETNTIYVGNQQVYGLGSLVLMASIYKKTKTLPRVLTNNVHFTIPGWKHFIELFGMVSERHSLQDLCRANSKSIIFFPGGTQSYFTHSKTYSLDCFDPLELERLVQVLKEYPHYKIKCFGNVGGSDMVQTLFTLPLPRLALFQNIPSIPFLIPTSYQRQYITIKKAITSKTYFSHQQARPIYLPLLKQATIARDDALDAQHDDAENRYLLQFISSLFVIVKKNQYVKGSAQAAHRKVRKMASDIYTSVLDAAADVPSTPGPIIEELEK